MVRTPKMYPHTKFWIPTSNKKGDMLPTIGLDKQNNSLPTISLAYGLGTHLSTHNICFG